MILNANSEQEKGLGFSSEFRARENIGATYSGQEKGFKGKVRTREMNKKGFNGKFRPWVPGTNAKPLSVTLTLSLEINL
jgi:hypothetical protein